MHVRGGPRRSRVVPGVGFGRKSRENRAENLQPDCLQVPSLLLLLFPRTPPSGISAEAIFEVRTAPGLFPAPYEKNGCCAPQRLCKKRERKGWLRNLQARGNLTRKFPGDVDEAFRCPEASLLQSCIP